MLLGIVLAVLGTIFCLVSEDSYGVILRFISLVIFVVGSLLIINSMPSALDVYRGRTTLEITYKDSIPIDSIVVYK